MKIDKFPFTIVDWTNMEVMERDGVTGKATSKIFHMGEIGYAWWIILRII